MTALTSTCGFKGFDSCRTGIYNPIVKYTRYGLTYITMYQCVFFSTFVGFSPAPEDLSSRSRLRGTQGGRLYTTAQVWVPTGFLGACSGRSKSPNLASNRGIAFRPARAHQTHANPEKRHFFFIFSPLFAAIFDVHSSCQRLGSHRTTVALSAFPFVTAIFIFSMLPAAAVSLYYTVSF